MTGHPCCVQIMQTVMKIVDAVVKRTSADVSDSANVLQDILAAAANERGEWELPLSQEKTAAMRQALEDRSDHLSEVRWRPKMHQDPAPIDAALDTIKCSDHPVLYALSLYTPQRKRSMAPPASGQNQPSCYQCTLRLGMKLAGPESGDMPSRVCRRSCQMRLHGCGRPARTAWTGWWCCCRKCCSCTQLGPCPNPEQVGCVLAPWAVS